MTADMQTYSLLTPDITNKRQQIIMRAQIIISIVIIQIHHGRSGVILLTSMRAQLPDVIESQIMGYTCISLPPFRHIKPD